MMGTWMAPRQGHEASPMPVTAAGRTGPAAPESAVAQAKLQPTIYLPSGAPDHRHAA
jgi:hypothetical protein